MEGGLRGGVFEGSSPHTRGARGVVVIRRLVGRIIPAYAGSTGERSGFRPTPRDHPRIRGEHGVYDGVVEFTDGSSPHTRGAPRRGSESPAAGVDHPRIRGEHKSTRSTWSTPFGSSPHTRGAPISRRSGVRAAGIIPAYAGSTCGADPPSNEGQDHPRIRGEHGTLRLL